MRITVEGIDSVMAMLQKFVGEDKLQKALAAAGEVVRADAAANAPVDTGRLAGSITCNVEGNSAVIGTNVEYAIYNEFGTGSKGESGVAHTTKKSWTYYSGGRFYTTSGMAARPFMRPALKNNISAIIAKFKEAYSGG